MCREETLDELSSGLDEDDDEESEEALTARNVFEGAHNETTIHSSIPNDDKDEKVGYEENSWITSPQGARGCAAATSSPGSAAGQPKISAFQQRSSPIL